MTYHKRKKLNLAVIRQFQFWLLVRILGVVLLSSLVAALILFFYARQEISANFYSAHIQVRRISDLLLPVMAAGAFVSLLSGMVLALFLPQKIAGPVYRIARALKALQEGDFGGRVRLRSGDPLTDLADSVNETAAEIGSRIEEVKGIQQELDALVQSLEHRQAQEVSARQNAALARLRT
ncbi:MAG TPA: methyl-accepting chemotaxis protein [Desulfurivibrio alkaliphilus]|uniref:Methyl-accepting chemotaxis protein n=1 Tax=Desulfurivibrio alkaliphilus TaxID=427923 RepID=A0A7C2XQ87_9BACT|nr:methyl-accepting chemotaxis protein [Desulfurivibrio alkaliphilus]